MKRVSSLLPSWDRTRPDAVNTNAKPKPALAALDRVFAWTDRTGANANRTSAPPALHCGKEAYWPTTLDKECEKAARILKSFCTDGYLAQERQDTPPASPVSSPSPKLVSQKIPPRIIQNAVGLAIFSCMRSGIWMSGSGGSGVLIARKADGTWSPPSGILLHTAGLGFVLGVDIYDCVLVINSVAALEMFTRPRVTLGSDISLTVGPLITTGSTEYILNWKELNNTVLTYLKAKGKHQGVRLDGSLVTERGNENERFYAGNASVLDIVAGNMTKYVPETRPLFEVIKAAEGRTDFDLEIMAMLSQQPAPGDVIIDNAITPPTSPPRSPFGIPNADDPDPFGVIALEMAGLEIRESGTRMRPQSNQFDFNPVPTSPAFSKFSRQSVDSCISRSNRGSYTSSRTQTTAMTDACTQVDDPTSIKTSPLSRGEGFESGAVKLPTVVEPEEIDYTKIDSSALNYLNRRPSMPADPELEYVTDATHNVTEEKVNPVIDIQPEPAVARADERDEDADDEDEDDDDDEDEPVIYEVATAAQPTRTVLVSAQTTQAIQVKGALVTIPKRTPPPLPIRSPARSSRQSKDEYGDVSTLQSPLRNSVHSMDLESEALPTPVPRIVSVSVAAAVVLPESSDEKRWSADSSASVPLSTPQIGMSSSAEESDREPKTPVPEDDNKKRSSSVSHHEKDNLSHDVAGFIAHSGEADAIAVV